MLLSYNDNSRRVDFDIVDRSSGKTLCKSFAKQKWASANLFESCEKKYLFLFKQKVIYKITFVFGFFYYYILIINKKEKRSAVFLVSLWGRKILFFSNNEISLNFSYARYFNNEVLITSIKNEEIARVKAKFNFFSLTSSFTKKTIDIIIESDKLDLFFLLTICGSLVFSRSELGSHPSMHFCPKIFYLNNKPNPPPFWLPELPFPDFNGKLWVLNKNGIVEKFTKN